MAFEYVRGYVQLASGLGELTRARAMEAAQGLLTLPGAGEVGKRAMQATEFADQLLEAARANRESLLALIRSEVESALGRSDVVRLADFDRARTALVALTREVDDLRASLVAEASRSPLGRALPGMPSAAPVPRSAQPATEAVQETVSEAVAAATTPSAPPAREATTRAGATKAAAGRTTKKATAKKSAAKKASSTKSAATSAGARTAQKSTAKKSTAKKSAATKSTAKKSTAKKSAAKKSTAKKTAATTSTTSNGNSTA